MKVYEKQENEKEKEFKFFEGLDDDVKLFFKSFKVILFITIVILFGTIISSLFVYGNLNTSQSGSDINYSFNEIEFFNSSYSEAPVNADPYIYLENVRNMTEDTGIYNATFSYTSETGDTSTQISFVDIDDSDVDTNIEIISFETGHNETMELEDYNDGGYASAINNINNEIFGTIEFWIFMNETIEPASIRIYDGGVAGDRIIIFRFHDNDFDYYNSGWQSIVDNVIYDNEWHHIRIDFECGVGGYLGLGVDDYYAWFDGVQYGSFNFEISVLHIDTMEFRTDPAGLDHYFSIDAVGYSWDTYYDIGDNINPLVNTFDVYEVDTWDFYYEGIGDKFENGDDNLNGWIDVEPGGDVVNYLAKSIIHIDGSGAGSHVGVEKDDFGNQWVSSLRIRVGFNLFEISQILSNEWHIFIYSNDTTEIVDIYIDENMELGYDDGSQHVLDTGLQENYWYYIEIDIDYIFERCSLEYGNYSYLGNKKDDVFGNYIFGLTTVGKDGLGEIQASIIGNNPGNEVYLDYIGVYINESSISSEFGEYGMDITTTGEYNDGSGHYFDNWNFVEYNMVKYNISGEDISVYFDINDYITHLPPEYEYYQVVDSKDYYGTVEYFNVGDFLYDSSYQQDYMIGGQIWFPFYNNFTFTTLNIYGLEIDDGTDNWTLEFDSGYLNPDDSKIYVSNNRVYFSMTTDDDNTEFLEITFKLYDSHWQNGNSVSTTNRSLKWGGRLFQPYLFADFIVNYAYSDYNSFAFKSSHIYTNQIIAQEKIIISFALLITDNDNDVDSTVEGFLEPMILYWNPQAGLDITITNYINIIPGIALISILSITIWILTKKKVGNMLVAPSIALTSFMAYISEFIPVWLLFVILISTAVLVYSKWKELFLVFSSFTTMILGFLHYGGVVDLWVFYGSFVIMIGYIIFVGIKDIKGVREE